MIKEIAEFHDRAFVFWQGRKLSQVGGKKKKRKREHAMFEQRLRGADVLICACEEVGVGPCLEERAKSLLWSLVFHLS